MQRWRSTPSCNNRRRIWMLWNWIPPVRQFDPIRNANQHSSFKLSMGNSSIFKHLQRAEKILPPCWAKLRSQYLFVSSFRKFRGIAIIGITNEGRLRSDNTPEPAGKRFPVPKVPKSAYYIFAVTAVPAIERVSPFISTSTEAVRVRFSTVTPV